MIVRSLGGPTREFGIQVQVTPAGTPYSYRPSAPHGNLDPWREEIVCKDFVFAMYVNRLFMVQGYQGALLMHGMIRIFPACTAQIVTRGRWFKQEVRPKHQTSNAKYLIGRQRPIMVTERGNQC